MQILIVSVCVNYLDYLKFTFEKNKLILADHHYYIVTDQKDIATVEFCKTQDINCFTTNAFYDNWCPFNKARAINTFFKQQQDLSDLNFEYILLLDADTIISNLTDPRASENKNLINFFIDLPHKDENCIYGCGRRIFKNLDDYNSGRFRQDGCFQLGFFQLFHRSKVFFNSEYLMEYRNASVYDCELLKKFNCKKCLALDADHIGSPYMNWSGRHPQSQVWR